jgi:hypothetical protein
MSDAEGVPGTDFGAYCRAQAAAFSRLADGFDAHARQLADMAADPALHQVIGELCDLDVAPPADLVRSVRAGAQRAKLAASVNAAQALAWDAMQAAGGPSDPDAYSAYRQASEFHAALVADRPEGD